MSGPTTATIKRLFAVSGNQCAFRGCTLSLVTGTKVTGRICHIKARSPQGPRYDPDQNDKERHGFDNLVLMCPAHHDVIDADLATYTVEELLAIKTQHQTQHAGGSEPDDDVARQFLVPPYVPPPPPDPNTLPGPGPLPPGSRLPHTRNRLFTGRAELLKALAKIFLYNHDGDISTLVGYVVQGMGGIGKTQLAVEFAYRYGRYFRGVHWIRAAQPENIGTEIALCGREMNLPKWPRKHPDEQIVRTLGEWQSDSHRLIILDNLEDTDAAEEWMARLSGSPVNLLLTARRTDWPDGLDLRPFRLNVFMPGESRAFLRRYLPEKRADNDNLDKLTRRLGHLPLALELAGRYLKRISYLSVPDYLDELEIIWAHPSMQGWREELGSPTGHVLDLAQTFAVSYWTLDDETKYLFRVLGAFASVPRSISHIAAAVKYDFRTTFERLDALATLSLMQWEDEERTCPVLHPLLHEFAGHLTPKGEQKTFRVELAINAVNSLKAAPDYEQVIVTGECLLALGLNALDLPAEIRNLILSALRELMGVDQVDERKQWNAASLLTRIGWLLVLRDIRASGVQDTTLEEFLIYLNLFDNSLFAVDECNAVIEIINRLLGTPLPDALSIEQTRMVIYRAIMLGKMGSRLRKIELLDASARDYHKARNTIDELAELDPMEAQATLAHIYLGLANIAKARARHFRHLGNLKAEKNQLKEAVDLYREANEFAQACEDRQRQVTIYGQLSDTLARLQVWGEAEQAYEDALKILNEMETEDPNVYVNDRAWVLITAGDIHLREGVKQDDPVEYARGYAIADEIIKLSETSPDRFKSLDLVYAHITAADCAWGRSKHLEGDAANAKRLQAKSHWENAQEIARRLGEEKIVADESRFYNESVQT